MSESTRIEPGDAIHPGGPPTVERYAAAARINHWIGAIAMVLLILSGLGLFHPALFFLTSIFGGGQTARTLHPWFGVILAASFVMLFLRFWRANLWKANDTAWVAHMGDLVQGHDERMPEAGKYNAGQKFVFWAMALLIPAMLATGIMIWDQYFSGLAPIPLQRIALIVHAAFAVFAILIIILHVYAAIWVRGSFDAMITGRVSAGWAWRHHRKWLRRLSE